MSALLLSAALSLIPLQPDNGLPPVHCAAITVTGTPLRVVGTGCVPDTIFESGFGG